MPFPPPKSRGPSIDVALMASPKHAEPDQDEAPQYEGESSQDADSMISDIQDRLEKLRQACSGM